jgi:alpha-L-fucosidase
LAGQFNPAAFNAEAIVKKAKEWGMRYLVFTSKHHDGFALYHSKCSAYNVVDATPFKRDVVAELADACRKHGMRFGLYYSQAQDWHDPDGYTALKDNSKKNYQAYLDRKCIPQLKEILSGYGDLALVWFDTPMGCTIEQSKQLIATVKSIQPDCIISGRIGNNLGEYLTTGDNFIPSTPYFGDWEVPATLNDTWGFNKDDHNWKDPDEVIKLLVKINSRGGNYLLNIGPDGSGIVPPESVKILDKVGSYVRENAAAVFGTRVLPQYAYELEGITFTGKAHHLYVHITKPLKELYLPNVANTVQKITVIKSGETISSRMSKNCEGDSVIEGDFPLSLRSERNYCLDIDTAEDGPLFEPLH